MSTHPEEHPAPRKDHLRDWVRLVRDAAVLTLERVERYWSLRSVVLERDDERDPLRERVLRNRPRLREIRQVCELRGVGNSLAPCYSGCQCTHWASERAQLPVQNADHAVLRRMENEVVQLVVAVHNAQACLALVWQVRLVPRHHV